MLCQLAADHIRELVTEARSEVQDRRVDLSICGGPVRRT